MLLFIVGPHTQHSDYFFLVNYLIDESVLHVDSTGVSPCQIADELLK